MLIVPQLSSQSTNYLPGNINNNYQSDFALAEANPNAKGDTKTLASPLLLAPSIAFNFQLNLVCSIIFSHYRQ
jgi:hypothetical protein